jgi:NADP-dependent 3-hydroxy acid dehydrogenase YdfG
MVTGTSGGIGQATARRFAREGFHIYGGARRERELAGVTHSCVDGVTAMRLSDGARSKAKPARVIEGSCATLYPCLT